METGPFCRLYKKGPRSADLNFFSRKIIALSPLSPQNCPAVFPNPSDECDDRRAVNGETNEHNRFKEHQQARGAAQGSA
jgi:hypothetical protein